MNDLFNYIYMGEVEIIEENVKEFVFVGDYLLIESLKDKGSMYLEEILSFLNCLFVRVFFEKYDCEEFMDKLESFIFENFVVVFKFEEFFCLRVFEIEKFIFIDDVIVESEEQVYEVVILWVKYDVDNRRVDFFQLFFKVCLGCMLKYYIVGYVEIEELVIDNFECMKLFYEVMKLYVLFGL